MTTGVRSDRMPLLLLQNDWEEDDTLPDSERRPSSIHPVWEPDLARVDSWVSSVGSETATPILLVEGPSSAHRWALYKIATAAPVEGWADQGLVNALTERLSKTRATGSITPHQWDLLWNLLTVSDLEVQGSLRMLVDQGLSISEAFKGIWEARFRLDEGQDLQSFVNLISRWMTAAELSSEERSLLGGLGIENEPDSPFARLDMLFFLATLARQNQLLGPTVFSIDGIEAALMKNPARKKELLKELFDFCIAAERWGRLGSPLGFVLGYNGTYDAMSSFAQAHTKLADKLKSYA